MKTVTFHLPVFDGPLDLLLHLIAKNKVNIYDIPISEILEQYVEYINQMREFDMEVAAEFVTMAAQLMVIKSKMLLPVYEDEAQDDPRAELVEALLEYQRFKEMGGYLGTRAELGRDLFVKPPEALEKEQKDYHYTADVLVSAIRTILERSERRMPPPASAFSGIVGKEPVPVGQKIEMLVHLFTRQRVISLDAVVLDCQSRSEVVALFLAVLELSKVHKIFIDEGDSGYSLSLAEEKEWSS